MQQRKKIEMNKNITELYELEQEIKVLSPKDKFLLASVFSVISVEEHLRKMNNSINSKSQDSQADYGAGLENQFPLRIRGSNPRPGSNKRFFFRA